MTSPSNATHHKTDTLDPHLEKGKHSLSIGGVTLSVSDAPESPLIPEVPQIRGVREGPLLQSQLATLRWMMQKAHMNQDMFLLGVPGPVLRHSVFRFCQLFRREVEYVSITSDTNEADLKQRREICNGNVEFVDQPPVRAAVHGRVLVLEGIEKAERNVLPLLNNLLENREMALEDRRFLLAPERAIQLERDGCLASDPTHRLVPVHKDFLVIALGLPGRGNPLDPPLRSRFAALVVDPMQPSESLESLVQAAPSVPVSTVQRLCKAAGALQQLSQMESRGVKSRESGLLSIFPDGGLGSAVKLLESFPKLSPVEALRRIYPVQLMPLEAKQLTAIEKVFNETCGTNKYSEYNLFSVDVDTDCTCAARICFLCGNQSSDADRAHVRSPSGKFLCKLGDESTKSADNEPCQQLDELSSLASFSVKELKSWLIVQGVDHSDCFEKSDLLKKAQSHVHAQNPGHLKPIGILSKPIGGKLFTASQASKFSAIVADHVAGMDICLVGERGSGKTVLINAFAAILGYRSRVIFCYKDMQSRDLLQRRTTDPNGNTKWHDSPLTEAAINGELAVLDGVHRLSRGTLYSTIGPLLIDREVILPDGSRLVSPQSWERLCRKHGSASELVVMGFRRVHPAFRCIACGEPPRFGRKSHEAWVDDEIITLFHFHVVPVPELHEVFQLVLKHGVERQIITGLFEYGRRLRTAALSDASLEPLMLTTRVLLRVARHLQSRSNDLEGALSRTLSACLRFLPQLVQQNVDKLFAEAMRISGTPVNRPLSTLTLTRGAAGSGKPSKSNVEMMPGIQGPHSNVPAVEFNSTCILDGILTVGDVSCPIRTPQRPDLVPDVEFVNIPSHVDALRNMLQDWSGGQHLLLVGNQGVGKNKLADRLLCLLHCEREYVQLHRDTTVQSLTLSPSLKAGVVVWDDSPLMRAVKAGRCLVIDEADKAPLEVVCVLKALAEDGELSLLDGRTVIQSGDPRLCAASIDGASQSFVAMDPNFRMVVLANRPGFPFLGNDFFRVCGDVFSSHAVDNPDIESEMTLLRSVGPSVPQERLVQLCMLFTELREMVEKGQLSYPYSTRELVKLVAHAQRYPDDSIEQIADNVFAFDTIEHDSCKPLLDVLKKHGIAFGRKAEAILGGKERGGEGYRLAEFRRGA